MNTSDQFDLNMQIRKSNFFVFVLFNLNMVL